MHAFKAVTTIRADVLKGLLLIAAKGDIRHYLNGIYFDTAHSALVATDGHKLIAVKCELDTGVKPFILPRDLCTRGIRNASKRASELIISIEDYAGTRTVQLEACGLTAAAKEDEGRYPYWRRVVPVETSGETGHYNAAYLGQLHEAFRLASGDSESCPHILHNGERDAALVVSSCADILGVVMPIRTKGDGSKEWRKAAFKSFGFELPASKRKAA